jgi:probable rRNA maturation factor
MSRPDRPDRPPGHQVAVEFATEDGLDADWDEPRLVSLLSSVIEREVPPGLYAVDVHLVGDATIRALNHEHRDTDAHTDVLSFPLNDPNGMRFVLPPAQPISLGDVVVSYPRVVAQANEFGHSTERELAYLLTHGMLHILGYDHEVETDREVMRRKEEEALGPLGFTR